MNTEYLPKGIIFNIQHYTIHDGPGIRSTVFLKGCPLKCFWCQNPESQSSGLEVFFNEERCTGCGNCVQACLNKAVEISEGLSITNREICKGFGKCVEVCPSEARSIVGKYVSPQEVFADVAGDNIFYQRSGGGVTLSGGEPLAQPHFSMNLFKLCQEAGIHTALDTCGYAKWEIVEQVLRYVDLVLFDIKHMNSQEHAKITGKPNEIILQNARKICHTLSVPMLIRVPLIPQYNDSVENIESTAKFVAEELNSSIRIHLLPYHRLGEVKHQRLETAGSPILLEPPSDEHMLNLKKMVEKFGLECCIGG